MSGHSKWSQIKHKKGVTDQKRGVVFSKLLNAISIAARQEPNPDFNPRLRSAVEKAKMANVPNDNIERAINKAEDVTNLEEMLIEAYGPEGVALIIETISDSKNRTMQEVKQILSAHGGKMAQMGAVMWSFDGSASSPQGLKPKYSPTITLEAKSKNEELVSALEDQDDVQRVITNINP